MDKKRFDSVLTILVVSLLEMITEREGLAEDEAMDGLYHSELYAGLEDEESKVWQYSTEMLYELYRSEKRTGKLELPEY